MGVKNLPANAGDAYLIPGSWKISWSKKWKPTQVLLPVNSHGQRSLEGYSYGFAKSWTQLTMSTRQYIM